MGLFVRCATGGTCAIWAGGVVTEVGCRTDGIAAGDRSAFAPHVALDGLVVSARFIRSPGAGAAGTVSAGAQGRTAGTRTTVETCLGVAGTCRSGARRTVVAGIAAVGAV